MTYKKFNIEKATKEELKNELIAQTLIKNVFINSFANDKQDFTTMKELIKPLYKAYKDIYNFEVSKDIEFNITMTALNEIVQAHRLKDNAKDVEDNIKYFKVKDGEDNEK